MFVALSCALNDMTSSPIDKAKLLTPPSAGKEKYPITGIKITRAQLSKYMCAYSSRKLIFRTPPVTHVE